MHQAEDKNIEQENMVEEQSLNYGFVSKSEEEKLKEDIFRSDIEKLQLFTRMLRRNAFLIKQLSPTLNNIWMFWMKSLYASGVC